MWLFRSFSAALLMVLGLVAILVVQGILALAFLFTLRSELPASSSL